MTNRQSIARTDSPPGATLSPHPPDRAYYPGLNGLRFYAAILVVIAHVSSIFGEMRTRPSQHALLNALALGAQSAVNLFFVLSGFLITYHLLRERASTGAISASRFRVHRVLRTGPVYCLVVFLGFALLPSIIGPAYPLRGFPMGKVVLVVFLMPKLQP